MKTIKYVGLDVHKNFITIAIADQGRDGEVRHYGNIEYNMDQVDKFIRKQTSAGVEPKFVYEAGPCGYYLYRYITGNGLDCTVVAPSQIPKKSGDRIKNDRRDAMKLARLHRAGELTAVYVPDEADEALRDLTRAREDAVKAVRVAKQQLNAFLLRHNVLFSGKTKWTKTYFTWLSLISMPHPGQQIALQEYIDVVELNIDRVKRLTGQVQNLSSKCRLAPLVKALQSMRRISVTMASIIAAELGDLKRFDHPEKLMAYLGLIPSEYSSGGKERHGAITKSGNGHVRRSLIEAAQPYRFPARKGRFIHQNQADVPQKIQKISWDAQLRLCGRYQSLVGRGKKSNVAKTAVARELAGFIWAISQEIPMAA